MFVNSLSDSCLCNACWVIFMKTDRMETDKWNIKVFLGIFLKELKAMSVKNPWKRFRHKFDIPYTSFPLFFIFNCVIYFTYNETIIFGNIKLVVTFTLKLSIIIVFVNVMSVQCLLSNVCVLCVGMWGFHDRLLTLRKALHSILVNSDYTDAFYRRWRWQTSLQNKEVTMDAIQIPNY